jgi:hypothetical protein
MAKQMRLRKTRHRLDMVDITHITIDGDVRETHEYLAKLPKAGWRPPADRVLVHNHVRPPVRVLGLNGFRAWLRRPDRRRLEVCPCSWAPELGPHFRVKKAWARV